jgi:hypothetical protein
MCARQWEDSLDVLAWLVKGEREIRTWIGAEIDMGGFS